MISLRLPMRVASEKEVEEMEEADRKERERREEEDREEEGREGKERERAQREEKERKERDEKEKEESEKKERDQKQREEWERKERDEKQRVEREMKEKQDTVTRQMPNEQVAMARRLPTRTPLHLDKVACPNVSPTRGLRPLFLPDSCGPVRVLVVDDNAMVRTSTRAMLKLVGATVDTAIHGADAVEKCRANMASGSPFHVIFMDVQMPEMDGVQATRRIRELGMQDAVVIGLTASDAAEVVSDLHGAGADDVLFKPSSIKHLRDKLDMWVCRSEPEPEPQQQG